MANNKINVYYGSIALFSSILHNVFLLYHVELFVSVYKIDKTSFWIGEIIFLVWNSCNDPLFGWMSDKKYLKHSSSSQSNIVLARLKALSWNGPLFALSFLAFWVSWAFPSLQFVVCLCLYDSFLTMIDLHHSALLADLAVTTEQRTGLNFYSSFFGAFGSLSVFLSYIVWHRDQILRFQIFCCGLALISVVGFWFSTRQLRKIYLKYSKDEDAVSLAHRLQASSVDDSKDKASLRQFVSELAGQQNFLWFAAMNLVQVFHCHFNSNFFPLFLENLLGDSIPQYLCSVLLGISFIAPHLNNLYFLTLCRKWGTYYVIRGLFLVKLGLSLFMMAMGPTHVWLLALYIASNRVFTEGTCKLLSLVISDLVDEDCVLHNRTQAVSALMFGTSSLLSKPGQTLAPLIGTWLLASQTGESSFDPTVEADILLLSGHDVFDSGHSDGSIKLSLSSLDEPSRTMYRDGVFSLLVYIPTVCAVIQLCVWAQFSLHGKRLQWIKSLRSGSMYATV
ncbi:hypothetical protein CAPTEDRAFT_107356 [Capitella teleta]|uniref:Transmembrane protein 180 n=1 Tax=Capitella teleta TaxID=283909 RepID=R7V5J8_CAPTE|nr:hypothetical protein CAPTEDRAFT_107356 [Capitella teleta]|eukprot:ELU13839.1 hypothetical protein CAPTEDRAFT_107356 [Capitella teleta]